MIRIIDSPAWDPRTQACLRCGSTFEGMAERRRYACACTSRWEKSVGSDCLRRRDDRFLTEEKNDA